MIYLLCSKGEHLNRYDEQRALASHLLQLVLYEQFGLMTGPESIRCNRFGKPYLSDHPTIQFSISHCQGGIALALDDCRTGIDIERIRSFSPTAAAKVLTDDEWAAVQASDQPDLAFFRFWTLKESYAKALGTGLAFSLRKVHFSIDPDCCVTCNRQAAQFQLLESEPGFVAAVCQLSPARQDKPDPGPITCLHLS